MRCTESFLNNNKKCKLNSGMGQDLIPPVGRDLPLIPSLENANYKYLNMISLRFFVDHSTEALAECRLISAATIR
jgi:hypothetical protein